MPNSHSSKYEKYYDFIRECYKKKIPNKKIIELLNDPDIRNEVQITKIAHRAGIRKKPLSAKTKERFAEKDSRAIEMIRKGKSIKQAAKNLGLNECALSRRLKGYYDIQILPDGKKAVDSHYFDEIDTERKAYWLGFLYADGYINEDGHGLELSVSKRDHAHLVQFKKDIGAQQTISLKKVVLKGKEFLASRISIKDQSLVNALVKHGCSQAKTFDIEMPQLKSKELYRHFIRGFFDGDGTISFSSTVQFLDTEFSCASLSFCQSLVSYAKDVVGIRMVISKDQRSKCFKVKNTSRFEGYRLANHLYENSTIYLERKYNRYKDYCRQMSILPEAFDNEDGIKRGWRNVS